MSECIDTVKKQKKGESGSSQWIDPGGPPLIFLMKTLRQIADEIGVSKQAVYKRYKGKLHTERSVGTVPEQRKEDGVVAVLQATIDTLQGQLSVKDKQIEELNARLAEVSSALVVAQQTAQALHAGTIRQQITSGESPEDSTEENPRRGFLNRLFGHQNNR